MPIEFGALSSMLHDSSAAQLPGNIHVRIREFAIGVDQRMVWGPVRWQLSAIDRNAVCGDHDLIGTAPNYSCAGDAVSATARVVGLKKTGILEDKFAGFPNVLEDKFTLTFEGVGGLRAWNAARVVNANFDVAADALMQNNCCNPR